MKEYFLVKSKQNKFAFLTVEKNLTYANEGYNIYTTPMKDDVRLIDIRNEHYIGFTTDVTPEHLNNFYSIIFRTKNVNEISEEHLKIVMPELFL